MHCSKPGGSVAVAIVASRAPCPSGRTRCAWVVRPPSHALRRAEDSAPYFTSGNHSDQASKVTASAHRKFSDSTLLLHKLCELRSWRCLSFTESMSMLRIRRLTIGGVLVVGLASYWLGMGWSFHRQRQAQVREYTRLLEKIDAAREKQRQLQTSIAQRRIEIRQQGLKNPPGDFWMPGEMDRLRLKRNFHREG